MEEKEAEQESERESVCDVEENFWIEKPIVKEIEM